MGGTVLEPYESELFLLGAACGIFCIVCAAMDWDWFMNHRKARFMCNLLGRKGARMFYAALGTIITGLGVAGFLYA